jgi:S-adenosylmethionine synthetase
MRLSITTRPLYAPPVEFVERKGVGHPDTICDRLAEDLASSLAADYLAKTGSVQHFNVDKAVLAAGTVDVGFGGGAHTKPSHLVLVGKADFSHDWKPDVDELAADTKRRLLDLLPDATPEAFTVEVWLNQSAVDLANVVNQGHNLPAPLSNDTSFAAVSLPRSPLEETVHGVEAYLNSADYRSRVPIGRDIKVMGARINDQVEITVAVPVLARSVANRADYDAAVTAVTDNAGAVARETIGGDVEILVNQADSADSQYLTLTGTSAEAGDDGQVGRGNRFGGLITPYRPMSLEAAAGKNPAAHVGKTYHAVADDIARRIVDETRAGETTIRMLSSIGHPVTEPQAVHVEIAGEVDEPAVRSFVEAGLADWIGVRDRLIAGEYDLF